jgi:tripartite-type tricarboxylate transporter receptor subunit TctC
MQGSRCAPILALLLSIFCTSSVRAADFYSGKQITMIVGSAVGGGYDTYARLVARYLPNFIPGNPSIVVQNLPAAGSLVAMNTVANSSPRDGLTIAAVQNQIMVEPIMGLTGPTTNARYDARKLNWIGSTSKEVPVVVAWSNSPIKTFRQVFEQEMLVGSSGTGTADAVIAKTLNTILDTKFKIIEGYKGNPDITIAAERGEIMGRTGWFVSGMLATQGPEVANGKIRVLVQLAAEKHPALPDVPLIGDFIKTDKQRDELMFSLSWYEAGRPFVAPPGVPEDRMKILREAFMKMVKSQEFQDEAKKMSLDVSPMTGEQVQQLAERLYETPKPMVERVRAIMVAQ